MPTTLKKTGYIALWSMMYFTGRYDVLHILLYVNSMLRGTRSSTQTKAAQFKPFLEPISEVDERVPQNLHWRGCTLTRMCMCVAHVCHAKRVLLCDSEFELHRKQMIWPRQGSIAWQSFAVTSSFMRARAPDSLPVDLHQQQTSVHSL